MTKNYQLMWEHFEKVLETDKSYFDKLKSDERYELVYKEVCILLEKMKQIEGK